MSISVCIATHNGERYIAEQLQSILGQLGESDEVIISDDGSTDQTISIIKALADERINIVEFTHTIKSKFPLDYATHNFANAMSHARGDVIFLSDQDDVWLPGHVEKLCKELEEKSLVVCDCSIVDEKLNVLHPSKFTLQHVRRGIVRNIFQNGCYQGSCMAFRREVFEKAQPFPLHYVGHDLWLGLIAEAYFSVGVVPEPLLLYRRREDSITFTGKKNTNTFLFRIRYRYYIVKEFVRKLVG